MSENVLEQVVHKEGKAILVMLRTKLHDRTVFKIRMNELRILVEALGLEVIQEVIQTRYKSFAKFHIGSGKVKEIQRKVRRNKVDIVIFYNLLKSSQKLNLIRALNCEVIDRYELTLEIFDRMASDQLSKLQIQSARLEKQAPFYKLQASINYSHDRPFFRSGGEYGFHGQLREISRNQSRIRHEIEKLMEEKSQRIFQRRKLGYPVICIAGYYNSGKTSLFNVITGDNKPVSDRPFTTLSSKYQKRFIDYQTTVLFIDTIGFVLDLDPRLIQSFKLNLMDIKSSDLVILLLEISDPTETLLMKVFEGIKLLKNIGVSHERLLIVFNKLDKAPEKEVIIGDQLNIESFGIPWITVSAKTKQNLQKLLQLIAQRLKNIEDNPPEIPEMSPFQRAETSINRILKNYPVEWRPRIRDPFRGIVSTVLSQNTNSTNQSTAYNRLEESIGITPYKILAAEPEKIIDAIRPAGMYNIRTKTLRALSKHVINEWDGDLAQIFDQPFLVARDKLMELPGIGPKTADVSLMFVSNHKVMPVDRHIERIAKRLELVPQNGNYEAVRRVFEDASTPDRFLEVHLSLIRFGRETCTARRPKCSDCVLNDLCPYPDKN